MDMLNYSIEIPSKAFYIAGYGAGLLFLVFLIRPLIRRVNHYIRSRREAKIEAQNLKQQEIEDKKKEDERQRKEDYKKMMETSSTPWVDLVTKLTDLQYYDARVEAIRGLCNRLSNVDPTHADHVLSPQLATFLSDLCVSSDDGRLNERETQRLRELHKILSPFIVAGIQGGFSSPSAKTIKSTSVGNPLPILDELGVRYVFADDSYTIDAADLAFALNKYKQDMQRKSGKHEKTIKQSTDDDMYEDEVRF